MPTALAVPAPPRLHPRQGGYLAKVCSELTAKNNMPFTYPVEMQTPNSVFLEDLFAGGNNFETHIGELLLARVPAAELAFIPEVRGPGGERTKAGKRAKEEATFAAYIDPAVRVLFNPRMGSRFEELVSQFTENPVSDEDRISEPDLIELGDLLPNGLRAMRFIDVKWHKITTGKSKTPKTFKYSNLDAPYLDAVVGYRDFYGTAHNEDWEQLAHYYRHAQRLGLVKAEDDGGAWAGVIGKEEIVVWADLSARPALADYDHEFAHGLAVVDNAIARDAGLPIAPIAHPEWKSDCGECPWRDVCKGELLAHGSGGHITLLPGITPARAKGMYALGITDVATLAARDVLGAVKAVSAAQIYTARVALDGRAHLAMDVDKLDMPRADIEVDFDCESEATVYMWGVRITDTTTGEVTERMFDDYTGTEDGEVRVFTEVWALFQSMALAATAAGRTVRFYHYTMYERTQMVALATKYAGQPGVPEVDDVMEAFDESGTFIDLYKILSQQIVWPTMSNSIKKLAVFAGFSWRDKTPGGDMSMVWYRAACSVPDSAVAISNRDRLREYNMDDVHAQAHLRDWAAAADLQSVTTLQAPPR